MSPIVFADGPEKGAVVFTMLIGEVDAVPGEGGDLQDHKISTRFFSFVGPLVPFQSMCVTYEDFQHHGRSSTHSYSGETVRLNVWSIVLGYSRVWLSFGVLALPFILYWGKSLEGYMFWPSLYSLVGAIAALVVPGLLGRGKRKRLSVLRRVVGLGCDPSYRYKWRRDEATGELMTRLGEAGLPSSPETLLDRVSSLTKEQLELVFATAWYQSVDDSKWKSVREAAWSRLVGD
jgi:hypothetical protein